MNRNEKLARKRLVQFAASIVLWALNVTAIFIGKDIIITKIAVVLCGMAAVATLTSYAVVRRKLNPAPHVEKGGENVADSA